MKKIILTLFLFASAFALISCDGSESDLAASFDTEENIYGVSVVTGIETMGSENITPVSMNLDTSANKDLLDQEKLNLMFNLLNDEAFKTTIKESDDEKYETLLEVEINGTDSYVFYYNEEVQASKDNDHIDFEKTLISGIIIKDSITYDVDGHKMTKSIKNNNRDDLRVSLKVSLDDSNYSRVSYNTRENNNTDNDFGSEHDKFNIAKFYRVSTFEDNRMTSSLNLGFTDVDGHVEMRLMERVGREMNMYLMYIDTDSNKAILRFVIKDEGRPVTGLVKITLTNTDGVISYTYGDIEEIDDIFDYDHGHRNNKGNNHKNRDHRNNSNRRNQI